MLFTCYVNEVGEDEVEDEVEDEDEMKMIDRALFAWWTVD